MEHERGLLLLQLGEVLTGESLAFLDRPFFVWVWFSFVSARLGSARFLFYSAFFFMGFVFACFFSFLLININVFACEGLAFLDRPVFLWGLFCFCLLFF